MATWRKPRNPEGSIRVLIYFLKRRVSDFQHTYVAGVRRQDARATSLSRANREQLLF
jgi:hypothetical protein